MGYTQSNQTTISHSPYSRAAYEGSFEIMIMMNRVCCVLGLCAGYCGAHIIRFCCSSFWVCHDRSYQKRLFVWAVLDPDAQFNVYNLTLGFGVFNPVLQRFPFIFIIFSIVPKYWRHLKYEWTNMVLCSTHNVLSNPDLFYTSKLPVLLWWSFAHCILSSSIILLSAGLVYQLSWTSSRRCWVLVGCFSFTLKSNSSLTFSVRFRLGDCGGRVMWCQHSVTLRRQVALTLDR